MHWYFLPNYDHPLRTSNQGYHSGWWGNQQWWLEQPVLDELEEARAEPRTLEETMGGIEERDANLGPHQRHVLEEALVSFDSVEALTIRDTGGGVGESRLRRKS